jgi:hypothetical protein
VDCATAATGTPIADIDYVYDVCPTPTPTGFSCGSHTPGQVTRARVKLFCDGGVAFARSTWYSYDDRGRISAQAVADDDTMSTPLLTGSRRRGSAFRCDFPARAPLPDMTNRKLSLHRHTLRQLSPTALADAAGGTRIFSDFCPPTRATCFGCGPTLACPTFGCPTFATCQTFEVCPTQSCRFC